MASLRGLDRTAFAHGAAAIMVSINGVHRFREGNGRTQRVFKDLRLAGVAGEQFMARTKTMILIGQKRDLPDPRPQQGKDFTLFPTLWDAY